MPANRSFTEYVAKRFDNNFWSIAETFVGESLDISRFSFYRIRKPGQPEVTDIDVKHIWVDNLPKMKIQFDVAFEVTFDVPDNDHHYDNVEEKKVWMFARCQGDLDKDLDDFKIYEFGEFTDKNRSKSPMDDALVPMISKAQLDSVAEQFLQDHYEKALLEPTWIQPIELAESMGLTVRYENITRDGSVFGRSFFFDCETELYNSSTDEVCTETVPSGTILVDKRTAFLSVLGAVNNTIIHECVHWDKHKKAFVLARLYDNSLSNIGCRVAGGIAGTQRDSVDWMEWQANALAPRIQMPITMFKKKVEQLISKYRRELQTYDIIDIIEPIIDDLVLTFGVSRLAAKIRMLDAGYQEASGAFIYIDNHYIKPHKAPKGYLDKNETFSISTRDAIVESRLNPELLAILENNEYVFVDSHFVLNSSKYLVQDGTGGLSLTRYARNHMDECCLVFELKSKMPISKHYHTECFLNRDKSSDITFEAHYSDRSKNAKNQVQMIKNYNSDLLSIAKKLPMNFSGALNSLIVWSAMTEAELAEAADISEKSIQRLRNEEPDNVTIETVMQLCIGMKLPPMLSSCLFRASGKNLMMTEQHVMYQFLLSSCYHLTIFECNDMLIAQNLKPLGRQNRIA